MEGLELEAQAFSFQLSAFSFQLSAFAFGCRFSAFRVRLLAFRFHLLDCGFQETLHQPRSGERMQPTAQAVGGQSGESGKPRQGRKNIRRSKFLILRRKSGRGAPKTGSLFPLLSQSAGSPNQAGQISTVDHPRSDICGEEKLNRIHRELRLRGRLAFADPDPSDSIACDSSISRCSTSSRKRDQHTRNAKQRNAIQLIKST